jgi:hypothetical protein
VAISTRVNTLANDDLRDAAHSGEATEVTWQAHGDALQIWRAASAAAQTAHLELIQHEGGMRQGAGAATSEEARDDQGWPF